MNHSRRGAASGRQHFLHVAPAHPMVSEGHLQMEDKVCRFTGNLIRASSLQAITNSALSSPIF